MCDLWVQVNGSEFSQLHVNPGMYLALACLVFEHV